MIAENENILIHAASLDDVSTIRNIAMRTWPVSYASILSAGQLEYMLSKTYSEKVLHQKISTGEEKFLIANYDAKAIAFASYGVIDDTPLTYKLFKVYVLPTFQKKRVGELLLKEVERLARESGVFYIKLNVNRNNNARFFYERLGFSIIETVDINIGNNFFMNDYVMRKELLVSKSVEMK